MKAPDGKPDIVDGVGAFLRRERELRHISLDDVVERTKISRRYLEALEEGRHDRLPGETFARAFIRSYAKSVGLDPDETMLVYNQAQAAGDAPSTRTEHLPAAPHPANARSLIWLLMAGLIAVSLAFLGIGALLKAPGLLPLKWPSRVATVPSPPVATPLILTAAADSDTWLRIAIDGQDQHAMLLRAGQSVKWMGKERFDISIGNARATHLTLNRRELTMPLPPQSILRHYLITRDMLQ